MARALSYATTTICHPGRSPTHLYRPTIVFIGPHDHVRFSRKTPLADETEAERYAEETRKMLENSIRAILDVRGYTEGDGEE